MYWVVLSGALLAESWTVFILGWLPFYRWIRLFFLAYLVLPQTQGARVLYVQYVEPFFRQHESEIEEFIGTAHERAKDLGFQYFYRAVDFIRERILGLPAQRSATPPPPPAYLGPAGYAQSLLSRFNLPSTGGALSSIGSSLTAMAPVGQSREDLSARGVELEMANMSRTDKMRYISSQRDILGVIGSALTREEMNLGDEGATTTTENAEGAPLRRNRSDNSFTHVNAEDVTGSSSSSSAAKPASRWTSGWFGGGGQASGAKPTDAEARSRA